MAIKDKQGNWIDASGQPVPPKYVDPLDKSRDKLVEAILAKAIKLRGALEDFRAFVDSGVDAHIEKVAKEAGITPNPGGNYTLTGFSGTQQVEVKVVLYMGFDERLQMAKQLIDSCLTRWTQTAQADLCLVVKDAFQVDSKGRINVRQILGMVRRTKAIKDPEWQRARQIIMDATRTESRRSYIQLRQRDASNGAWETIRLDLATTGATGAEAAK
jgi:hypothetical protein